MKKLYIGFILLFGFLAFIPQIANSVYYNPCASKKLHEEAEKAFNSDCLQKYKSNLSQQYERQKLNVKRGEANSCLYPEFPTENEYFVNTNSKFGSYYYKENSYVLSCGAELLQIRTIADTDPYGNIIVGGWGNVNVINVQPGSFLKFSSDTLKVEVIPPTNIRHKSLIVGYKKFTKTQKEAKSKKEAVLNCFREHKFNISKEYKGQKLSLTEKKTGRPFGFTGINNRYFVDPGFGLSPHPVLSKIFDCQTEIIDIVTESSGDKETKSGVIYNAKVVTKQVNVIDVPLDSYLKYFPETQEVTVITPSDKEYGKFIKQKQNGKEKNAMELNYLLKQQPAQKKNIQTTIENNLPYFAIKALLIALILTLVIEGIMALPFGWKFVGLVSLTNLITNLTLNLILWNFAITSNKIILLFEVMVILIEWGRFSLFIKKNYVKLFLFSLCANTVSYLIGYLLNIL